MKTPIVISTLEEDFKKIGLIKTPVLAESAPAATATEGETLDEAGRIKMALRGGKKVRQQKTSAKERRAARKYRKSAAGKKAARMAARKRKKPSFLRRLKKLAMKALRLGTRKESVDAAASTDFDMQEALKSFANAAIISEKLAEAFKADAEELVDLAEDDEFDDIADLTAEIAEACADLAEGLAQVATSLNEGNKSAAIPGVFNESMDFLLDAVELYEAVEEAKAEAEATDDEGMEDEEEEDDEEEMGND